MQPIAKLIPSRLITLNLQRRLLDDLEAKGYLIKNGDKSGEFTIWATTEIEAEVKKEV